MFAIIFMWTPPHFWALSIVLKKDYARAGVPMLPVVKGESATYRQITLYTVLLLAVSLPLYFSHALGVIYLVSALALGGGLFVLSLRLMRIRTLKEARRVFWFSNYYLALLFAAMVVDHIFLAH
jgi:protoheme IX farnesyltransferase